MVLLFRNKGIGNGLRKLFSDSLQNICPDLGYHDVIFNELSRLDFDNDCRYQCDMIKKIVKVDDSNDCIISVINSNKTISSFSYNDLIKEMKRLLLEDIENTMFSEESIKITSNAFDLYDNYNKVQSKYIEGVN